MSKERARRREQREVLRAAAEAKRLRLERRRSRRRSFLRRLKPRDRRRAWGLGRRSPAQRAFIVGVAIALLWIVWYVVESLALRIGFSLLVLLLLPVLAVLTFDRKGMKL